MGQTGNDPEVQSALGNGASISAKDVEILAQSQDTVYADTVSAAGGGVAAGAGAQSSTSTNQTVQASVGSSAFINASGSIKISSFLDQSSEDGNAGGIDSRAEGIAVSGSVAGGGASITNAVNSQAQLIIGDNSQIIAPSIDLGSNNNLEKTHYSQKNGNGTSPIGNIKVVVASFYGAAGSNSSTNIGNDSGAFGSSISLGSYSS